MRERATTTRILPVPGSNSCFSANDSSVGARRAVVATILVISAVTVKARAAAAAAAFITPTPVAAATTGTSRLGVMPAERSLLRHRRHFRLRSLCSSTTTKRWWKQQQQERDFRGRGAGRRRGYSTTTAIGASSSSSSSSKPGATRTPYTIDCPPTDPDALDSIVRKHVTTFDKFLKSRPIAAHTSAAYGALKEQIRPFLMMSAVGDGGSSGGKRRELVLDSGCGTGRSSLHLGSLHPDRIVIGVDKSIARLEKNRFFRGRGGRRSGDVDADAVDGENRREEDGGGDDDRGRHLVRQVGDNVWLVRANLVDFWHCCLLDDEIDFVEHYVLYPNPYPKKSRLKQRFYAHPAFPLLLQMTTTTGPSCGCGGGGKLVIRSNWEQYLREFAASVESADRALQQLEQQAGAAATYKNYARQFAASARMGPTLRDPRLEPALTNFEEKYDEAGEATYELIFEPSSPPSSQA